MKNSNAELDKEAQAFDNRITERTDAGFIPDLRRAVKCDYFYKSFWRDPFFIRLYLGKIIDELLNLLQKYCGAGLKILDVGCGAGYMSLELARNGYHVTAIDISNACIDNAEKTLRDNPYTDGFGSLKYQVMPFHEAAGSYDVVLFCVSMHHMENIEQVVQQAYTMIPPGGHVLCYEPCHERFRKEDAAQVALIRGILSIMGHWFKPEEVIPELTEEKRLDEFITDIHSEYIFERDKDEPEGQSPHDLSVDGDTILRALRARFAEIEVRPGFSFIYRLLGGMRGPEETLYRLAEFITRYEQLLVKNGYLKENMFYFLGRKNLHK